MARPPLNLALGPLLLAATASARPPAEAPAVRIGVLASERVPESSGIAIGRANPDRYWTHNDSGDGPNLYLLDPDGALRATFTLAGAEAADWEDLCSFELDGKPWLLVGDIGSARGRAPRVLYLVEEPAVGDQPARVSLPVARRIEFRFPGRPRDAESLAFDPLTRTILLVTKLPPGELPGGFGFAEVFALPLPAESTREPLVAEEVGRLDVAIATAADISPDGRRLVVLALSVALEFAREGGEPWREALGRAPRRIPLPPRRQGEAIAYAADGRSLVLSSEGVGQPLWLVPASE